MLFNNYSIFNELQYKCDALSNYLRIIIEINKFLTVKYSIKI